MFSFFKGDAKMEYGKSKEKEMKSMLEEAEGEVKERVLRQRLVDEMQKLGIEGINIDMSIDELKRIFNAYKNQKKIQIEEVYDRQWAIERIRNSKVKTKVKKLNGATVVPQTYMELLESDIFSCKVLGDESIVAVHEGGKYKYDLKAGILKG